MKRDPLRFERLQESSLAGDALEHLSTSIRRSAAAESVRTFERAFEQSVLYTATVAVENLVRTSSVYQWLTAEPDREPITIDIGDSRTVGLLLDVIKRIADRTAQSVTGSTIRKLGVRVIRGYRRSILARSFGAIFKAPDPPE
jgi:hypothetical protein